MDVFDMNREIWHTQIEPRPEWAMASKLKRIIIAQIAEIEEHEKWNSPPEKLANEYADILLLSARAIEALGFDPETHSIKRLRDRHMGKTDEIRAKYEKT